MTNDEFNAAMERVFAAAGCKTQTKLAEFLDIRQSSISDAKRRRSIPSDWLIKLLRHSRMNPDWILTGEGPKYLQPSDDKSAKVVHVTWIRPPGQCTAQELVNELVRRAMEGNHST